MSNRHLARALALQSLYEWDFHDLKPKADEIMERNISEFAATLDEKEFALKLIKGIVGPGSGAMSRTLAPASPVFARTSVVSCGAICSTEPAI